MKITSAIYDFFIKEVIIKEPFEIKKETEKCFFTVERRYLKSQIGKPRLKYPAQYPYIELVMVDADEATLRENLSKWFTQMAYEIWKMN